MHLISLRCRFWPASGWLHPQQVISPAGGWSEYAFLGEFWQRVFGPVSFSPWLFFLILRDSNRVLVLFSLYFCLVRYAISRRSLLLLSRSLLLLSRSLLLLVHRSEIYHLGGLSWPLVGLFCSLVGLFCSLGGLFCSSLGIKPRPGPLPFVLRSHAPTFSVRANFLRAIVYEEHAKPSHE